MIKAKCAPYTDRGKPAKKTALINSSDHAIVATFGTVYRGVVQYYLLAGDVFRLHRLQWVMETSMLKTLAAKHRSSVSKMAAKHKARIDRRTGPESVSRPESSGRTGRHWWPDSVGFPSNGSGRRNSPIVSLSGWTTRRRNSLRDSWRIPARSAEARATCKCTTSALSPISHMPDGSLPTGRASCSIGAAKQSWPATSATTVSIRNGLPDHSRSSHWRAG
ncbi:hypothetical protein JIX56_19510 [Streptomyces sp. CA-210063]|nr:hypothetical protein JIX56_19510 [Streptomyces sp. CA-210063]